MAAPTEPRPTFPAADPRPRTGLRGRLWLGCLGATLVTGVGLSWVLGPHPTEGAPFDPRELAIRLALVFAVSIVTGIMLAAWLDRGIVARVRALSRGVGAGELGQDPGYPSTSAWGELGDLARRIESLLGDRRQLIWSADELARLKRQLVVAEEAIGRWTGTEQWQELGAEDGPLRPVIEGLNRGFTRQREVQEQNREAAGQVRAELLACLDEAREAAEQAEHGFVEATATLTTVNELQRLATELEQPLMATPADAAGGSAQVEEAWRTAVVGAIEELIGGAGESVERLAAGFLKVQAIGEQVHLLSNRATLIALNSLLSGPRPEGSGSTAETLSPELKQLALEVRSATTRVTDLSREIEREIQAAPDRMRGIRERVAARLEQAPPLPAREGQGASEDARRLFERLREMIQDAARKGERFSKAAERASRTVQAMARRLEEEGRDMDGLVVRLSPTGPDAGGAGGTAPPVVDPSSGPAPARPAGLRLLESGESPAGDEAGRFRREDRS